MRATGIDFDKDIVQYHALIARFNDVFNEHENIEEKIYLSENEISDNKVRVVEEIQN